MKKVLPLVVAASMLFSTATSFSDTSGNTTTKFLEKKFNITDSSKEFKTIKSQVDELGYKHESVQQIVNGIPVYGNQYRVHYDANGSVYASDGKYDAKAKTVEAAATITAKDAVIAAKTAINYTEVALTQQLRADRFNADLYLVEVNGEYKPCYVVNASWLHANTFGNHVVFVDANNGEVVRQYDNTQYTATTGTGIGVLGDSKTINIDLVSGMYYLRDVARAAQTVTYDAKNGTSRLYNMMDTDTIWNSTVQKAGVDAHYYLGKTYDFTKSILGRNGIDNNNLTQSAVVHYSTNYVNAFWDGTYFVFGDGDGVQSLALSAALDIVAHEYAHAIVDNISGFQYMYQNQTGALIEGFADIFACAVEYYLQSSKFDWTIGEDVWTPNTAGDAIRSLSNPSAYGDPDHMSQYISTTNDNGGVHTNSLIPGHAGYVSVTGTTGAGIYDLVRIWYRAILYYFGENETFSQAKAHLLQSAADLYGVGSTQYNAIQNGWDHVGVY